MKRTITVTGRGEITLCPDTAKLTMELREEGAEHAAVTDACDDRAELLLTALGKAGIARDLVKVLSMRVEAHYKTTDGTRMLAGYTAEQRLLLLCKSEAGILADVLKAVLSSGASPLLSLDYIVRDPEQYRAQLISLAVEDAAHKADIIAQAANVRLGPLLNVTYAQPAAMPLRTMHMAARGDFGANLTPDDMTLSDEITAVYEIE